MSELEQYARVSHRLATTSSAQISPILSNLLPKLLLHLGKPTTAANPQIRAKLLEIISHVIKRAKAEPDLVQLPIQNILSVVLYDDATNTKRPNISAFTLNFSMVLLETGLPTIIEDDVNKPPILSAFLTLLSATPPLPNNPPDVMLSTQISHLLITRILQLSKHDRIGNIVGGEIAKAAQAIIQFGDNKLLQIIDLFPDIILYFPRISTPPPPSPTSTPSPSSSPQHQQPPTPPQPPTQLVPAGCSQFGLTRLLAPKSPSAKNKSFNNNNELAKLKMATLRLISPSRGNLFGKGSKGTVNFVFLLVAALTDNNSVVADLASSILKNHLDSAHSRRLNDEEGDNNDDSSAHSLEVGDPLQITVQLCDLLLPPQSATIDNKLKRLPLFVDPSRAAVVLSFLSKTVLFNHMKMFDSNNNNSSSNNDAIIEKLLNVINKGLFFNKTTPSSSLSHRSQHLTPIQKCQINSATLLNTLSQMLLNNSDNNKPKPETIQKILSFATLVLSRVINIDGCFPTDARDACYGIVCSIARYEASERAYGPACPPKMKTRSERRKRGANDESEERTTETRGEALLIIARRFVPRGLQKLLLSDILEGLLAALARNSRKSFGCHPTLRGVRKWSLSDEFCCCLGASLLVARFSRFYS